MYNFAVDGHCYTSGLHFVFEGEADECHPYPDP